MERFLVPNEIRNSLSPVETLLKFVFILHLLGSVNLLISIYTVSTYDKSGNIPQLVSKHSLHRAFFFTFVSLVSIALLHVYFILNAGQNIWNNLDKSTKTEHSQKTLICFGIMSDHYWRGFAIAGGTSHLTQPDFLKSKMFLIS